MNIISVDFAEIQWEHSNNALLPTHSDFSRALARAEYHTKTFLRRNFLAPTFSIKAIAGISSGDLPPQRQFLVESAKDGFAPYGVLRGGSEQEFGGDRMVVIALEHNFRSIPFLWLNIPFLYKNSIELVTFATFAQAGSAMSSPPPFVHPTLGWYSEAGVSIGRIFGLLRVDMTRRFTPPSDWVLTLGISTIM